MMLFVPAVGWPSSQVGYSFTMTAGTLPPDVGYSDGTLVPAAFGNISSEPIPSNKLLILVSGGAQQGIFFNGNILADVTGLILHVNGVGYPFDADWSFSGGGTQALWSPGNAPVFSSGNTYNIEIK